MESVEEILKEREKRANKDIGKHLLLFAFVNAFVAIISMFGIIDFYHGSPIIFFIVTLLLVMGYIYCYLKKWESEECKYIIFFIIILAIFVTNIFVNFKAWMLYIYPTILSYRYYNKKFMWINSLTLIFFIAVSSLLNIYSFKELNILDLNIVAYDNFVCDGTTDLLTCVTSSNIEKRTLFYKVMTQALLPNVVIVIFSFLGARGFLNDLTGVFCELSDQNKKVNVLSNHITKLGQQIFVISREKEIDFLTQLQNRQTLFNDINNKRKDIKAVYMIDIDDFKNINDTFGHKVGDEVLRKIGKFLKEFGLKHNIKFYRYGGEEIVGILYESDEDPKLIARELIRTIRTSELGPSEAVNKNITISLGVSLNNNQEDLVREADIAMYEAKRNGKNCYEVYSKKELE